MTPDLPCPSFLGVLVSLVFFLLRNSLVFLIVLCVLFRIFKGSHGEKNPWWFWGFLCIFQKTEEKKDRVTQETWEGYGPAAVSGIFSGGGECFPNREMLQILKFSALRKANLPGTLGRHHSHRRCPHLPGGMFSEIHSRSLLEFSDENFCRCIATQMGAVSWYNLVVYILLSAERRAYFCKSIATDTGCVLRYF